MHFRYFDYFIFFLQLIIAFLCILRFQAGILGYSIAGMKAFEGKFSYKNQLFS